MIAMVISTPLLSHMRNAAHVPLLRSIPRTLIQTVKFLAFTHLFAEYFFTVKATCGPSMLPTINVRDDWVLISKLSRRGKDVEVGDVVSLIHPMVPDMGIIKRILGMPGDFVLRDTPGILGDSKMIQVCSNGVRASFM